MKTSTKSILTLMTLSQVIGSTDGMAAPKQQKQTKRPNILFIIADDASYHHFSNSGCPWVNTPNFDRVGREGITFSNCYTPNAKSAPSRAILLTGCYSWQLGEAGNHICHFPEELKVFTDVLAENGYTVACTGKGWAPGNPGTIDGAPRKLTGKPYMKRKTTPPATGINHCDYAANFKDFLEEQKDQKPWFFWMGCHEPHRKYEYGSGVKIAGKRLSDIDEVPAFWPDNDIVRNDMLDYSLEIEYFDQQIGKALQYLEEQGELDNTLILITADNGMPFPRCKANDYEYANHMPFVAMWHDGLVNPGRTVDSYVSFIDMAPTILDAAGCTGEEYGMQRIAGKSILDIVKDRQSKKDRKEREEIILGRERDDYGRPNNQGYPIRAIIKDHYLYIWNVKPQLYPAGNPETGYMDVDGSPTKTAILNMKRNDIDSRLYELSFGFRPEQELYDLSNDPYCVNNLAGKPEMQERIKKMDQRLKTRLAEENDPRLSGEGDIFDHYRFDTPDKWNFYERYMNGEIQEPWLKTKWISPTDYETYKKTK